MYDPNMGYWVEETENGPQEVQIPHEEVNARLEEMKSQGRTVRPMQYFKFRGEKGEKMEVPQSELEDFYQSAMESGKRFAPVFTMVDPKTGEKREFAKWGKNEQGSDYQANIFIGADRRDLAEARANGWKMEGVQDPGAKEIVDHFWNAENWTDPTGEDGALVWNAKNIAKGVAAAAVAGATGVGKAIPNAVLNIGAAGASLVGADDVADTLRQGRDWVDRMLDHSVLTEQILTGPGWDNKALKDFGLNSAESLGSLWGLGGAVKTVGKGLKVASGIDAGMGVGGAGTAAAIEKVAGEAALATIMGAEAYEGAMADPRIRDAGPKGKVVAAANLLTAAATSRLFGKIVGLGVEEKLAEGIAKEGFADALKVTGMEMLEFAGINELNAVTDESAKLLTGLSDRDIGRITKRFGTEAVEGGKTVLMLRAGRYGRIGAEKIGRMALEKIAQHTAEARRKYVEEAKPVAETESGVGVLDDGGMVRNDGEGKKEVVTPNGVVVDETGGVKTVAPGRCGNVGEEYGIRVEGGRTANKPGAEIPSFGRQTVENACILLNEIEQGACKGEVVDIDAITDIRPSWKGEGGSGAVTPTAESLPNAPLVALEGADGSLRLVNGRGRLAYAKEQGARQVRVVKLREADGWTPELAYCVDVVENLRSGAPIGGDAAVAAIEKLGLGYAEAEEMGLLGAKGGTVARAARVVEYGSQHLIDAVKGQIIPLETAESIVDSTVGDRLGAKSEEWNALTEELTGRLSLATRDEARDVMFELDRVIQEPGMDMADPASRKAAVDAAVDAAMERRRAERAERNGTTVEEEAAIGSTPVETEDGRLTTVRGLEREKEEASHAEAQSRGENAPEEETKRDAAIGTELKPKEEGAFGCATFPGARISMQTVESADGTRGEAVVIEGLTAEEMLKPERREEATAFLQRAAKAAQEAGKELCIPDEAAREAAMRLLEDRAVEETREEMARAEEQRRTDEVAASGQAELANKVFGGTATVRVGTEQERAEVERMASNGDRRQSIGKLYTGSAADYADKSRQGGKGDGPSLVNVGTGEGSQVYGWGLYASDQRGVAEKYAEIGAGTKNRVLRNGEDVYDSDLTGDELKKVVKAKNAIFREGGVEQAVSAFKKRIAFRENWIRENGDKKPETAKGLESVIAEDKSILAEIESNDWVYDKGHRNIYEQTFFTNRPEGDESHLLSWYEPVGEENAKRILRAIDSLGLDKRELEMTFGREWREKLADQNGEKGYQIVEDVFRNLVDDFGGSESKAASELLVTFDIDGVKYPVDSYGGKTVKDGDKAGWNYVSFRDDNIRVDHKWVDGEKRYLRDGEGVFGYWDRAKKECVLFRGADETTLAHEMGWHAAYQWAEENNPALFRKMKEWAASCPKELREAIREAYGEDGPLTEDVLLDEFGAGRFEREHADTLKRALQKPEAKHWWTKLMRMVADAWKGALRRMGGDRINLKKIERMTPEEAVRFLAEQMAKGRKLGEFGAEGETGKRFARKLIDGKETAVAIGYPLPIREARNPEKVMELMSGLVGKSAAQLGEMKLTRITEKSVEHLVNSKEARFTKTGSARKDKKETRTRIAGISVTQDIIATSGLGTKRPADHLNKEWKKDATFYEAETRFAIETEDGNMTVFPCRLVVCERKGERIVYDIVEIGQGIPTTSRTPKGSSLAGRQEDYNSSPQRDYNSMGVSPDAQSLAKQNPPVNPDVRYSRRGNGSAKDDLLPAREAMAHIWENGVRIVKEGAPGYGEQAEAGRAAGAEAMNADVAARRGQDLSVSMSEMLELVRAMTGNPAYPRVMKAMKDRPWLGQVTKKGEVQIDAELFGIVDRTDRDVIKNDLKQMGMFRNEDPAWSMRHSKAQNENEREMSEFQLTTRLKTLADQRVAGTAGGGNRTALNVMAHEIGHIACDLPVRPNDPALLKGLHTLGDGLIKEFQKADVKLMNLNQRFRGLNGEAAGIKMEALEFVRWWRGVGDVNAGPGKGFEDYFRRNDRELWAEVFGAFLAAPHELETRAPAVFREIKDAIGRSDVLMDAFRTIRANRGLGGAAETVMRRIEKEWDYREQVALKNLAAELDKPIGGAWHNFKGAFHLNLGSNESPATMLVTEGVQARIKELKAMRRRGALSESQYRAMAKDARRVLDDFRIGILEKQRGGGAGRLYAEEFLNKALEGVKGAGIEVADFRRYLKAQRVIEVQGRAMDAGMSPREARQVLDALKKKLGTEGWRRMEGAAKMFQALREKHILDDAHVREMFGDALIGYWRQNVHYVTTRRRANAEEVEAYADARAAWKAAHPNETDVLADMEAIFAVCRHRNYGESGDVFTHRLEGSFKMSEDPLSATLANDLNILAAARRNHYVCELAKAAKELKLEGFMEVADAGMHIPSGSNRYGEVAFLKDGRRMRLVMPKMVAEGFRRGAAADINALVKMNRKVSAVLTQYSPRFAWRNMFRNRETNNINIPWMRESAAVTAVGLAGMRPVARLAEMLVERVMVHLPDRAARNAVANVFWGPHTNMYYVAQATRYAKWMEDPGSVLKRAREADDLATKGEYAKAQAIVDDIATFKELVKRPVFAGAWRQALGQTDRTDLDAVFDSLGMKAQPEGGLKNIGRIAKKAKEIANVVKRYNNFEEARIKFISMLAAEHDNMIRRAKGKEERSRAQIDYTVATMSGSPRYEQRGRWMNFLEVMCGPFMNVGMKGAWRTVEAMKMDPKAWWSKAALRYSQRVMTTAVFGGGLAGVACGLLRKLFEDDEEMQGRIDGFEKFCRRQTAALANISSYRLRNYDIIPIATFGKYTTFALNMPRGDEDRLLMPFVDMTVKTLLGSDAAKARGFTDPIDTEMGWSDAIGATFASSGILPDLTRQGILLNVVMDAAGPWLFDVNQYNTFTQRGVYAKEDFDTRSVDPVNFLEKQGKQLWNDLGGQVLLPMPTWDEDEASYAGAPESAWSTEKPEKTLGEKNDGEEEGDGNGPVHWAAGSIFKLLHTVPFLSSMASGLMTLQSGGNVRIARRLAAMDRERQATLDKVATDIVDLVAKNGTEYDYEADLDEAAEKYGLEEEDRAIVQTVVMRKAKKLAGEGKMLDKPILQVMKKAKANPAWYRRVRKTLIGYGWTDLEED